MEATAATTSSSGDGSTPFKQEGAVVTQTAAAQASAAKSASHKKTSVNTFVHPPGTDMTTQRTQAELRNMSAPRV
jgi:hypothetical protein